MQRKKDMASKLQINLQLKNKDEIKKKKSGSRCRTAAKKIKKPNIHLENVFMQCFSDARAQNISISGKIVKEKAEQFSEQLKISDVECSTGWLDRCKEQDDLTFKKVSGEANSVDSSSMAMSD